MNCPNLNNPDNKRIIEAFGEDSFWKIWTESNGIIPEFVYQEASKRESQKEKAPVFNDIKGITNISVARQDAARPRGLGKEVRLKGKQNLEKRYPGLTFEAYTGQAAGTETTAFSVKVKEGYEIVKEAVLSKEFIIKKLLSNPSTAKVTRIIKDSLTAVPTVVSVSVETAVKTYKAKPDFNAFYDPVSDAIVINSDKVFSEEQLAKILLEEMIHAQTALYLRAGGEKAQKFKDFFEANKGIIKLHTGNTFERELANADEFLAALFYNEDFRNALKNIPSNKTFGERVRDLFNQILFELAELFGVRALDGKTLFADALVGAWDIIQDSNGFVRESLNYPADQMQLIYNDAKEASYYGDQINTYEKRTGNAPTLAMKTTVEKLLNRAKLITFDAINHTYTDIYGNTYTSVSDYYTNTDVSFYGKNDPNLDEQFPNNKIWGNQVDELLRKVILGLEKDKAINEMSTVPGLLLTEEVMEKVYDSFIDFKNSYPDAIILTQQVLFNPFAKVAGTADIVLVFPDGKVKIVDLKTSIYPVGYKDGVYEKYTTVSGKQNSYANTSKTFASRKQRVEAQLSCYKGLAESMGVEFNIENPISVLPVQVIQDTENTDIISDVNPEPELNTLNPIARFSEVLKRTDAAPIKESVRTTDAIDNLLKAINTRLNYLAERGIKKQEYYKLKGLLDSGLPTLEGISKVNNFISSTYNFMVKDEEKGFPTISDQFDKFLKDLPDLDPDEVTNRFLDYKKLLDAYQPVMQDLKELYVEMKKAGDILPNNETFRKLEEIIETFIYIKTNYNDNINNILAKSLAEEINPEVKAKLEKELAQRKARYDSLPDKNSRLGKDLKKKIDLIEESIEKNSTPEGLLEELSKGSSRDISVIDFLLTPAISSSNPIIALVAKKVKRAFENARLMSRKFAGEVSDAFEKFKTSAGYSVNSATMYEGMYEKITEYKNGKPVEVMAFVQPYNVSAYERDKREMEKRISETENIDEKRRIRQKFYKENTVALREDDLVVNGVTIIKGQKTLIAEKQNLVDTGIWSKKEFEAWMARNIRRNLETGEIIYSREFSEPAPKYNNPKFDALLKGTDAKSEYFRFLLSKYFKAQERVPVKRGFKLPAIAKSNADFLIEDPKGFYKFKKERITKRGKEEEEVSTQGRTEEEKLVDDVKSVPVLYSFDISPEEVSLDLTASLLSYDYMTRKYEASNSVLGISEAALNRLKEAGVRDTDSLGNSLVSKAAQSMGIDNWNKYRKKHDGNNSAALLEAFIDMQIYNIKKAKEEIAPFGKVMDAGAIVDTITSLASITQIGGNPLLSVANSLQANAQMFIESAAKEYFSDKALLWAKTKYYRSVDEFAKDMGSPVARSFMGQLIELYDPMQGEYTDKYGRKVSKNEFLRLFNSDLWFAMQQMGEHAAAVQSMLALMYETKVKDKSGQEMNLFDAYELDNAGKINLKQGVELKGNLSEDKLVSFDFQNRLHAINKRLHGVYNSFDAPTMSRYSWGRLLLMYRKHVAPGFKKRLKGWSVDQELGGETEGFYITFYKTLFLQPKELLKELSPLSESNLTPLEKANLRRALREQAIILLTGTAAWLLTEMMKEMDDEEKRKYAHLLYWTLRLNQEVSSYGGIGDPRDAFVVPSLFDMYKSFRTPTAAYGVLEKAFKLITQLSNPFEEYERDTGIWKKGDLKIYAKFLKLIGITGNTINPDEAIDIMQMQK